MPEAEEVAWKGLKGIGKGMKAGAVGSLKAAEKVSMTALEGKDAYNGAVDKLNDKSMAPKIGEGGLAKGGSEREAQMAAMKARAAAAAEDAAATAEPEQVGGAMGMLGDFAGKAKAKTLEATDMAKETASKVTASEGVQGVMGAVSGVTAGTLTAMKDGADAGKKVAGVDEKEEARARAMGGGQEMQFDEEGNPIIPTGQGGGAAALVGDVAGGVGGIIGGVVGGSLGILGGLTDAGKKAAGIDEKEDARQRAMGGGQEITFDADGNPILSTAAGGGGLGGLVGNVGGGVHKVAGGMGGMMGGLAGKAKAAAAQVLPTSEEGVPPAASEPAAAPAAEPEIEPEQAMAKVKANKWASKK